MMPHRNSCRCILFLLLSCILFGADNGLTAWFVFVPILFLVEYVSLKSLWIYGGAYGAGAYLCYAPWLVKFSISAAGGVYVLTFAYCAALFACLRLARLFGGAYAWIFQFAVICLYEYLKTKGFLGFSYGVNGYTQYANRYLIQIADIFGVWGVSALVNFSSVLIFKIIRDRSLVRNAAALSIFVSAVLCAYGYGIYRVQAVHEAELDCRKAKVIAVQNNADPWKGGAAAYREEVASLMELTRRALQEHPDAALVAWPETAIVPSIMRHYYERTNRPRVELIQTTLAFIDRHPCAFVVGNFHSELCGEERLDFNAALLFAPQKNVLPPNPLIYKKKHLVPFTEYFPYGAAFPKLYAALLSGDTHLWTPGDERNVFTAGELAFGTPICFEDTFGSDCAEFVRNGARAFVNLSNDAWAYSRRCQMQHLKMAVFRCVENRVPAVRCAVSGETCIIDSSGRITVRTPPFQKNYAVGRIPIKNENFRPTVYCRLGGKIARRMTMRTAN